MFSTGSISLGQISLYFGVPHPINMNQLYRGGSYVYNTPQNSNIPTSGTISLANFRNSYNYPFDITTIMSKANSLVNSVPGGIEMPPYSSSDHFANYYWSGTSWVQISQDSYGGGDSYGNTMRGIFPAFFTFIQAITNGIVPTGNGNNVIGVGTKYTSLEGFTVNNVGSYGYSNSDQMTFNYLNAIIHGLSGVFVSPTAGPLQNALNAIDFSGSRTNFIAGMQSYVNFLYTN
jgi:hypothetical protein